MKNYLKINRLVFTILALVSGTMFLVHCTGVSKSEKHAGTRFEDFAGSAKCASCHKDIYESHLHTEHFLSSEPANPKDIPLNYQQSKNRFYYNPDTYIAIEKRDKDFFQVQYILEKEVKATRMDIVIGSGRKGQSYLNWNQNSLAQLPVTFFSPTNQWSTSPGYPANRPVYNRPITSRCLECHSTYFEKTSDENARVEEFDRSKIIFGIDCEKCHGPAARHVQFQMENPGTKEGKYIVNPSKLTRQQSIDLCALCHGGRLTKTKPSFTFQVGDSLSSFFNHEQAALDATNIDVHGNQLGLLSASKCFLNSQMTCVSCHNTHENEREKLTVFSQRCQTCHSNGHEKVCKKIDQQDTIAAQNCIDCHMPKQASKSIAVNLPGVSTLTPVMMRTHWIKIYPDETKKVVSYLKGDNAISATKDESYRHVKTY